MSTIPPSPFDHASTTDEVLEGIDLGGSFALVTGASGGLGEETARALASRGARILMTARDLAKGEAAAEKIRSATGATVSVDQLELDSLDSVRAFAKRVLAEHASLDLLINNAGVMACPKGETQDGFERQFGTNHIGHFLLTCLLAPALRAGAPSRVVNLSSGGHRFSDVLFDDPNFERSEYDKWISYGQSKTANVLFAVELDRRLRDAGVRAFAVHPGAIMTELGRHLVESDIATLNSRSPGGKMKFKQVPAGAATSCYAATSPQLEGHGGLYLEDCHVAERNDDPTSVGGVRGYALDPEGAARLWSLSEGLVGERFDLA